MKKLFKIIFLMSFVSSLSFAGGAEDAEELLVRLSTERLTVDQMVRLVENDLASLDLQQRIIYYSRSLKYLQENGLPRKETDALFLRALNDLKHVPKNMFSEKGMCNWGEDGALECLSQDTINMAMSNIGMSPSVAQQYVVEYFKMPWLTTLMVQGVSMSLGQHSSLPYPYMRYMVEQLLKTDFPTPKDYKSAIAFNILRMIRYSNYSSSSMSGFLSYGFSYEDSLWILKTVLKSGYEKGETKEGLKYLDTLFSTGIEFEKKVKALADSKDVQAVASVLQQMMRQPEIAVPMSEIAFDWLRKNSISESMRVDIVRTLLSVLKSVNKDEWSIRFRNNSRGAVQVLTDLPLTIQLPKYAQEEIYRFVIESNLGDSEGAPWGRNRVFTSSIGAKPKTELPGLQMAMEMLAEVATAGDSVSGIIGDPELNYSNAGRLVAQIADCESAKPYAGTNMKACAGITSKRAILEKIINNSSISSIIKNNARKLL
ncbi:MAG: hypothetical protein JNL11_19565 [Bdellovibrionaceae bacterium]|nr:hypothetical protein [Pseudobdellovibrionaceae bacterium]